MSLKSLAFAASLLIAATSFVAAQEDHSGHQMQGASPAESEYRAAMDRMHQAMGSMAYSGNADVDFARGMIPHHQAAIDMAKTVIQYGTDPEIRKLAEDIVAAQEREIAQLEAWLAAHGTADQ